VINTKNDEAFSKHAGIEKTNLLIFKLFYSFLNSEFSWTHMLETAFNWHNMEPKDPAPEQGQG